MPRTLSALVIGNAAYSNTEALNNPTHDADDIAAKLMALGFQVSKLVDASTEEMDRALAAFSTALRSSDVGLFFFAGHGFQIDGSNYLAGIDTKVSDDLAVQYSALNLDKIIQTMKQSQVATSIVILDACRNNPFEPTPYRSGAGAGLATVYAPKGSLIAFSTSPGERSRDGSGRNGAYTEALLKHLDTPDLPIETMFKRVRNTLDAITGGQQTSWEHTSLAGEFRFRLSVEASNGEYGSAAISDSLFVLAGEQVDHQIIRALKSYNWYKQNPAVASLSAAIVNLLPRDSMFIIGRNIYQAACGNSSVACGFINDFMSRTEAFDEIKRKSVLDGILFEIVFDSEGQLRKKPKVGFFNEVFKLMRHPELSSSFSFLSTCLGPYVDRYYVLPGTNTSVHVDILAGKVSEDEIFLVNSVKFEGREILRDTRNLVEEAGLGFRHLRYDKGEFEASVSEQMLIPQPLLRFVYHFQSSSVFEIEMPPWQALGKR
jgi:hypothetical protein